MSVSEFSVTHRSRLKNGVFANAEKYAVRLLYSQERTSNGKPSMSVLCQIRKSY